MAWTILLLGFVSSALACDPMVPPSYIGAVPSPRDVLGFDLGERQATIEEVYQLVNVVALNSPRVVVDTLGDTVQGRPLTYTIVSEPQSLTEEALALIRADAARLRDPTTPVSEAREIAQRSKSILWVAGSVHGNEPAGCDASLRMLYELSDRNDCAAEAVLANSIVVILSSQNPDGRANNNRRNANGFDLNRDWFAASQPETQLKLAKVMEYPPVLFLDVHEMGGESYFFPPNADPYYHDLSPTAVDWINNLHGGAMKAEFEKQGLDFFTGDRFDLFYAGYGDSYPTLAFTCAGITLEKGTGSSYPDRTYEHYLAIWMAVTAASFAKEDVLADWHAAHVQAALQGSLGQLLPNRVFNAPNEVEFPVPAITVREYFIFVDDDKEEETQRVVARLLRGSVELDVVEEDTLVQDFRRYGRAPAPLMVPAGTLRVSTAQGQKHYVQAMLGEDSYVPFPVFGEVTAWNALLLENIPGGYSAASFVGKVKPYINGALYPGMGTNRTRPRASSIALLGPTGAARESLDWLAFLLRDVWEIDFALVSPQDVVAGLGGFDLVVAPDASASATFAALGAGGVQVLRQWVAGGGRFVGFGGGAVLAGLCELTSASFAEGVHGASGVLVRASADAAHPLMRGVGAEIFMFYSRDAIIRAPSDNSPVMYPSFASSDFFVSGFSEGLEDIGATAAVVAESLGEGEVVLFGSDPNRRAFTGGMQRVLRNAIEVDRVVMNRTHHERKTAKTADVVLHLPNVAYVRLHNVTNSEKAVAVLTSSLKSDTSWSSRPHENGGTLVTMWSSSRRLSRRYVHELVTAVLQGQGRSSIIADD